MVDDEDDLKVEELERRREVRGLFQGLTLTFAGQRFEAVEASRRGFFARVDDPDRFVLGEVHDVTLMLGDTAAKARLEIIRKEIAPRGGIALRIAHVDPANEDLLRSMLGSIFR